MRLQYIQKQSHLLQLLDFVQQKWDICSHQTRSSLGSKYAFLVHLELRECVWSLQMLFSQTKSQTDFRSHFAAGERGEKGRTGVEKEMKERDRRDRRNKCMVTALVIVVFAAC